MSNIWTPSLFFSLSERKFTLFTCISEFFKKIIEVNKLRKIFVFKLMQMLTLILFSPADRFTSIGCWMVSANWRKNAMWLILKFGILHHIIIQYTNPHSKFVGIFLLWQAVKSHVFSCNALPICCVCCGHDVEQNMFGKLITKPPLTFLPLKQILRAFACTEMELKLWKR